MHAASSWEGSSFKLYFDEETEAHRVAICGHNRKRRFCNLCAEKSVLCPHNRRRPLCAVCDDCWSSKPPQARGGVTLKNAQRERGDMSNAIRKAAGKPADLSRQLTEEGKESEGEGKGGAGGSETESKNASAVRSE